jgi:WD40 repeat protein
MGDTKWKMSDNENVLIDSTGWINAIRWSPNSKLLAVAEGGSVNRTRIWDAATGTKKFDLACGATFEKDLEFSPDGTLLVCNGSRGLTIWNTASGRLLQTIEGGYEAVAFSPFGSMLEPWRLQLKIR